MIVKLFSLICLMSNLVLADGPRIAEPLLIDFMRSADAAEVHWALRCSHGVGAETESRCELRKQRGTAVLAQMPISAADAQRMVSTFFSQIPRRELSQLDAPFKRVPGSPVHWRVSDGKRFSQGGFVVHGTKKQEQAQAATQTAVLLLELELESRLILASRNQ